MFSSFPLLLSKKEHPVMCCVIGMFVLLHMLDSCSKIWRKYTENIKRGFQNEFTSNSDNFFLQISCFWLSQKSDLFANPNKKLKCLDWCYPTVYWPFPYLSHLNFSGHCLWWALTSRSINILISERMHALIKMYLTQARSLSCLVCHSSQSQRNGTKPA